jgi:hypothetical protein
MLPPIEPAFPRIRGMALQRPEPPPWAAIVPAACAESNKIFQLWDK